MDTIPSVSVIVPVYNRPSALRSAIHSLAEQTVRPTEAIIVDDGSTDSTATVCDALAEDYSWVRVMHQQNAGVAKARNTGIGASRGEWIAFLDSDDKWDSDRLQSFARTVANDDRIDFFHGNRRYMDGDKTVRRSVDMPREVLTDPRSMIGHFYIKTSTVILRRSLLDSVDGYFPESLRTCEDFHLFWRCVLESRQVYFEEEVLVTIEESGDSLSRGGDTLARLKDNVVSVASVLDWMISRRFDPSYCGVMKMRRYRMSQDLLKSALGSGPLVFAREVAGLRPLLSPYELARAAGSVLVS
ncbi:MAG: glycosyltransferase family A protein [Alphaproteobacteria bacterium]